MVARISVRMNTKEITREIGRLDQKAKLAIRAIVERNAVEGLGYAKVSAPWTDQTGAARAGLSANTEHSSSSHKIIFAHGVHYGIWLEVKNSGKYEIILPTVARTGGQIMSDLSGMFGKMR